MLSWVKQSDIIRKSWLNQSLKPSYKMLLLSSHFTSLSLISLAISFWTISFSFGAEREKREVDKNVKCSSESFSIIINKVNKLSLDFCLGFHLSGNVQAALSSWRRKTCRHYSGLKRVFPLALYVFRLG